MIKSNSLLSRFCLFKEIELKKQQKARKMKFSDDLENWMSSLPERIRDLPLIYLAIPGSHDSASYGITRGVKVAPDAEPIVKKVYRFIPCVVRRWAKTQKFSIEEQLINGIRYDALEMMSASLECF